MNVNQRERIAQSVNSAYGLLAGALMQAMAADAESEGVAALKQDLDDVLENVRSICISLNAGTSAYGEESK